MREEYEVMRTPDGAAWIRSSQFRKLQQVDAIAFDCDGVLVDTRGSYDATIVKVVDQILNMTLGLDLPWKQFASRTIVELRRTGRFNNDWDTTYALILFSVLALPVKAVREYASSSLANRTRRFKYSRRVVVNSIASIVTRFCCDLTGAVNTPEIVDRFVTDNVPSRIHSNVVVAVKRQLAYPGSPPYSLLSTLFDEVYHGPILFRRMYGVEARHYRGKGLIEKERVLIKGQDLDRANEFLKKRRLAMITGRPYLAAEHVLREILRYFDLQASLFIGDIDAHPELGRKRAAFRKPSWRGLAYVRRKLSSHMLLYVGDSAEDIEMVENARMQEEPVLSAGIYGTSVDRSDQLKFLVEQQTDLILPSARKTPDVLRYVKNEKRPD
jgi:phosphoglycolate phosphatase-like HAD superfamily hydrolase